MNTQAAKQKWKAFFESRWYAATVAILLFLAHSTLYIGDRMLLGGYQAFFFGGIMGVSLCAACFLCNDARFLITPFISFFFILTREHTPNIPALSDFLIQPLNLSLFCGFVGIFLVCLVWFMIRNRKTVNPISFKSPIFLGLAVFAASLLTNGLFSPYYQLSNLVFAALFGASMVLMYLFFAAYAKFDRSAFSYALTCVMTLGLLISAQVLWLYLAGQVGYDESGNVIKETVLMGWGIWTTVGGMLVFTLPATLYFAHSGKYPWIYWLLALVQLFCLLLTQSRGALLFGGVAFLLSAAVLCISGRNKVFNRIFMGSLLVVGCVGALLLFGKLRVLLQNYLEYGFSDNGRFEKYLAGWNNFVSNPVFGAGFYGSFSYQDFNKGPYPYFYHNTLIQMMGSGGILALGAYLWHRFTTVRLAFKMPNPEKTFMGLCVLSLLMFSLLDVLFFNTYPNVLYGILLLYMEKSDQAAVR